MMFSDVPVRHRVTLPRRRILLAAACSTVATVAHITTLHFGPRTPIKTGAVIYEEVEKCPQENQQEAVSTGRGDQQKVDEVVGGNHDVQC